MIFKNGDLTMIFFNGWVRSAVVSQQKRSRFIFQSFKMNYIFEYCKRGDFKTFQSLTEHSANHPPESGPNQAEKRHHNGF